MSKYLKDYIYRLFPKAEQAANDAMRIKILDRLHIKNGIDEAGKMATSMRDSLGAPRGNIGQIGAKAGLSDRQIENIGMRISEKEKDTDLFGKWSAIGQPTTWETGRVMGEQAQRSKKLKEAIERIGNQEIAAMDRGAMPNRKRQDRLTELAERRDRTKKYVDNLYDIADPYNRVAYMRGLPSPLGDLSDEKIETKIPGFTKWMEKKKLGQ